MGAVLPFYRVCPTQAEPGADDAPLGTVSIEADRAAPPHQAMMPGVHAMTWWGRGIDSSTSRQIALSDTVPAPESLGVVGPGVARLLLLGYPDSTFLPAN
jgi:hypothetical protein